MTVPEYAQPVDELAFYEPGEITTVQPVATLPRGAVVGDSIWTVGPDGPAPLTVWDRPRGPFPW